MKSKLKMLIGLTMVWCLSCLSIGIASTVEEKGQNRGRFILADVKLVEADVNYARVVLEAAQRFSMKDITIIEYVFDPNKAGLLEKGPFTSMPRIEDIAAKGLIPAKMSGADQLETWRGGLRLYRIDPTPPFKFNYANPYAVVIDGLVFSVPSIAHSWAALKEPADVFNNINRLGAEHQIVGQVEWHNIKFDSDPSYRLTFKAIKGIGYVYLCGRGTVTTKDGKVYRLGYDDSVNTWLSKMKSIDYLDREGASQAIGWLAKTQEEKDKAVSVLIDALKDEKAEVQRNAAEALGRIGDRKAVEALKGLAETKEKGDWLHKWIQFVALVVLEKLKK